MQLPSNKQKYGMWIKLLSLNQVLLKASMVFDWIKSGKFEFPEIK